jgi:hypothetical protein
VGAPEGLNSRQQELAVPTSAIPKAHTLELNWLVGAERENPFELPDLWELWRWYKLSLGVIVAAGVLAGTVFGTLWLFAFRRSARVAARITLWIGFLVLGVAATPLANRLSTPFLFTWPVSLFAVHQIATAATIWARQPERRKSTAWLGMLATSFLILTFAAYYDLTRRLSLAPAWYFLPTLVAAWPLAIPAAVKMSRSQSFLRDLLWMVAAFSFYFFAAGGLMLWRGTISR